MSKRERDDKGGVKRSRKTTPTLSLCDEGTHPGWCWADLPGSMHPCPVRHKSRDLLVRSGIFPVRWPLIRSGFAQDRDSFRLLFATYILNGVFILAHGLAWSGVGDSRRGSTN